MKNHVAGIPLKVFEDPVHNALTAYREISGNRLSFSLKEAVKLECTPDKPNSARSSSPVYHRDELAGGLFVIAFAPGDGTGDENTYKLSELDTDIYPSHAKVVPRSKKAALAEVAMSVASFFKDQPNTDPKLYAGNLLLLGLNGTKIVKEGELGQPAAEFQRIISGRQAPRPTTTFTVGHRDMLDPYSPLGERFADPHAVYNPHPETVQLFGFLALSPEREEDLTIFLRMNTAMPAGH